MSALSPAAVRPGSPVPPAAAAPVAAIRAHNVERTNDISNLVVKAGCDAAVTAIATAALGFMNPIGGAILGGMLYPLQFSIAYLSTRLFTIEDNPRGTAAKTLVKALVLIGSLAATGALLAVAGFPLTLPQLVSMGSISLVLSSFTDSALKVIGIDAPNPAKLAKIHIP